jgi:putative Mn2+ efflux pump MntP
MISTFLIALGLAVDAFSVSVALGANYKKEILKKSLASSLMFAGFHTFMPLLGWMIGSALKHIISSLDHWIAFGLLTFIGLKMIKDSISGVKHKHHLKIVKQIGLRFLLSLAVATSIDTVVVGMGLAFLGLQVIQTVGIIGLVTFVMSSLGTMVGYKFRNIFRSWVGVIGGLVLALIGLKILIDHIYI